MASSGIPGVTWDAVTYVERALLQDKTNAEAGAMFSRMIQESLKSWFTQVMFILLCIDLINVLFQKNPSWDSCRLPRNWLYLLAVIWAFIHYLMITLNLGNIAHSWDLIVKLTFGAWRPWCYCGHVMVPARIYCCTRDVIISNAWEGEEMFVFHHFLWCKTDGINYIAG